jgi:CheY-like chemotaxis protein
VPALPNKNKLSVGSEGKPGVMLAIEDDPEDVELLRVALAEKGCSWTVVSVAFARDAIMYLGRVGKYGDESRYPRPNVIVLDLGLPGMSGLEFLLWAVYEPNIPPIMVLTNSRLEGSRELAERLGVKGYFTKSTDLTDRGSAIETLLT